MPMVILQYYCKLHQKRKPIWVFCSWFGKSEKMFRAFICLILGLFVSESQRIPVKSFESGTNRAVKFVINQLCDFDKLCSAFMFQIARRSMSLVSLVMIYGYWLTFICTLRQVENWSQIRTWSCWFGFFSTVAGWWFAIFWKDNWMK